MFIPDSLLDKQVATRNLVNKAANEVQAEIQALLLPLVGTKIIKATPYRSATKKVKELLEPIQNRLYENGFFRLVFDWSLNSTVWATLDKTYQVTEGNCNYVKREIYICSLNGDCLCGEWQESEPGRTDYTEAEVIETRKEIARLNAIINELKSKVREFPGR